jgi:carbon monoxide dehydrogenase subunit G
MQVKLEKQYAVAASPNAAWQVLRDIRQLAACMPGAEITGQIDDTHYKGNVKVKVGPASAAFGGEIEILALDEAGKTVRFKGKGADKSGSSASMDLTASIRPGESASQCILLGNSDVIVNGKFAQFGGRMMTSVSDMMLAKFADNFSHQAADLSAQADQAAPQAPSGGGAAQNTGPVKPRTELNAFSVLWGLIRNFFSGLLGARK